ncbi:hypothetical protein GCM10022243_24710 [Saccharothrix violaceirubra]|uniref:Uncharacterized protein n=1 Tax=Saccharothrix violaceirubra TaxID=413306 RepID=A0A7W7T7V9_9PSEU|nr:hypothetical protein [Saccharothrix violaceirubra]MBB4967916.1 hypothetical protein [Saccharothrix violaceirubra]
MEEDDIWIRLNNGWEFSGIGRQLEGQTEGHGFGWALWQPGYVARPWPYGELKPGFTYYLCDKGFGERAVTARATVVRDPLTVKVHSVQDAFDALLELMFDDLTWMPHEVWHANPYNRLKFDSPWPQRLTAWRVVTEPFGPLFRSELARFPRCGWLKSPATILGEEALSP